MTVTIRPAVPADADVLMRLIDGLNEHVGAPVGKLTRDLLLRDALCETPHFTVIVAEVDGIVGGYATWCDTYETEHATAGFYMNDLYVDPAFRRHGLARRLVARVAAECRRQGHGFVWWTQEPNNAEAAGFYASIGSQSELMVAHALYGEGFDKLADEAG